MRARAKRWQVGKMSGTQSTDRQRRETLAHRSESTAQRRNERRRGFRIAPVFWMTALAAFIVIMGVLPAAGDPVPSSTSASITVRVSPADTLWSIAADHRLPGVSTAQMVRIIVQANTLRGTGLHAGAVILVPSPETPGSAYAQVTGASSAQ